MTRSYYAEAYKTDLPVSRRRGVISSAVPTLNGSVVASVRFSFVYQKDALLASANASRDEGMMLWENREGIASLLADFKLSSPHLIPDRFQNFEVTVLLQKIGDADKVVGFVEY